MSNIELERIRENEDGYIDYNILMDNKIVGLLQTIEVDDRDYIFARQISINNEYRRQGIAKRVINQFIKNHDKMFRFCIATNSNSAINFWANYLENTNYKKTNIRGQIWNLEK